MLRLTFETDCEFRSGSLVFFEAEGTEACGTATNLAATESAALRINGTEPDGTHLYQVGFAPTSRLKVAQSRSTLEVFANNAGSQPADADDILAVTLPKGFTYAPGSVVVVLPTGYTAPEPTIELMGDVQQLEFAIPVGLAPGEEFRINFDVQSAGVACGDDVQSSIAAYRYMTAACVSQATTCRIPSDITVGGLRYERLPVGDEYFSEEAVNRSSCAGPESELLELALVLTPNGFTLSGADVNLTLYSDLNGDGLIGVGDTVLNIFTAQPLAGAPSVAYAYDRVVPRRYLANLYLRIDATGSGLCEDQIVRIGLPTLENAGAQDNYTVCASDGGAGLVLGDASCSGANGVGFSWTSVPAGFESYLSDVNVAAPTLSVPPNYVGPDTVRYVIASDRTGVGVTTDTVTIAISPGVTLGPDTQQDLASGSSVVLQPGVLVGNAPLRYAWSPTTGLSDAAVAQPIASPTVTTVYTLVVTDALGCSASNQHTVRVDNGIVATPSVRDTTLCPGAPLQLTVAGGNQVDWTSYAENPSGGGGLSSDTGNTVDFGPTSIVGRYRFLATVSDAAFPGVSDTVTITVRVALTAACLNVCDLPTLTSEIVVNADCAVPSGSISLSYTDEITDYVTQWRDASGRVLSDNALGLRDLEPGAYTMTGTSTLDATCVFTKVVYVSATDAPNASIGAVSAASCGATNGSVAINTSGAVAWPDGSTSKSRSDLAAGTYWVAVAAPATPACGRYLRVVVPSGPGLTVAVGIDRMPDCNQSNGSATLSVAGGSGSYDYSWSSGAATNASLAAGTYRVTVTDRASGCIGTTSFVLANASAGVGLSVTSTTEQTCAGDANGGVGYTLTLDPSIALPLDSVWQDARGATVSNGTFTSGEYCLVIRDANGCVIAGTCVGLAPAAPIAVDLSVGNACGTTGGTLAVRVTEGATPLSFRLDDGRTTGDLIIAGLGTGSQSIAITDAAGCPALGGFTVGKCSPCGVFGDGSNRVLQTTCGSAAELCLRGRPPDARQSSSTTMAYA